MNSCIKCGRQIPEGELFCTECGLNPGSSLFEEPKPAPVGKMQTPKPRKSASAMTVVTVAERKTKSISKTKKKYTGLKVAFVFVTLLLVLVVGFLGWQYEDIMAERERLNAKETAQQLIVSEKTDLEQQVAELNAELEKIGQSVADKDQEIKDLQTQLSGSESDQDQSTYNPTTAQAEIARLEEENAQLLLLEEDLEAQIKELKTKLETQATAVKKGNFLDLHVVFANNDDSNIYHTYDCPRFVKVNFDAYSRRLAEDQGLKPCATCGGKVQ